MKKITARVPDSVKDRIRSEAAETDKSQAEVVRKYLQGSMENKEDYERKISELENKINNLEEQIQSKEETIESKDEQIQEVKENRRNAIQDKEDKIDMLQDQIQDKEDQIKELQSHIQELQEEKDNTATFGEWVTSINPLARFFIKAGLMMAGWKIPERVKENEEN